MDFQARTAPHPRPPLAIHPEPEALLLAAVQRRDRSDSRRLAQRLVHRRGLDALGHFLNHGLPTSAGEDSQDWLRGLLGATAGFAAQELTTIPVDPLHPLPQPNVLERQIEADVDAAIAAMLATFPSEQLAQLPARQAFTTLEQLDPGDLVTPQSVTLERSAPPAELLVDPEFQGGASLDAQRPPLTQPTQESSEESSVAPSTPLSFRIEPRAAEVMELGSSNPAFPSARVDAPEPERPPITEMAKVPGDQSWPNALRERLRRRLPRAARALKEAMAGSAWRGSWWQSSGEDENDVEGEQQSPAPMVAGEALTGGPEALLCFVPEADSNNRARNGGDDPAADVVVQPSIAAAWVHQERDQPGSASLRLMQRLSEREGATVDAVSPAPRPSCLSELRAWLPEARLPHAS